MSVDENDIEKPQPPRKRRSIVKTLIKILLPIIVLIGALQYVCYYYALPIVKSKVCDAVYNNSKGLYTMDFKGLRINILGRRIEIDSFSLRPDTAAYLRLIEQEHYNKAIYNIAADHLHIEHIGIKSFFSQNELYIKEITINHPIVRLVGKPDKTDQKIKYDAVHTDLYPIVSQFFNSLNIRHIDITDGFFDFHTKISENQMFGISKIDISLRNFYLNEEKFLARNQFFYSDEIYIHSRNYNIELADQIHRITAGNLTISTKDSSIYATDVQMISDGKRRTTGNRFDASLDSMRISGLDISRAYFQKDVNLSGVMIYAPKIKFFNAGKVNPESQQFESSRADLYSLIKGTLRRVAVNYMTVSDASMRINKPTAKQPAFDIDKIDILLQNFTLDSLSHRNRDKILYSDNLEIGINKYRMLLPDLRHQFSADSVLVSTSKGIVKATKIGIKPVAYSRRDSTAKTIQMSIPRLEVSDIDFKKAFNSQMYEIGSLRITLPDIKTRSFIKNNDSDTIAPQKPGKGQLLTALSNEYFKSLRIRTAQIYRGKVDITSKAAIEEDSLTFSGKFSIVIGNLTLNRSIIKDELIPFHSNSLKLNVEDVVIKPSKSVHTLRCGHLTVDTQKDKVLMTDFSYASDNDTSIINTLRRLHKHSLLDIKISKTEFSKTNLIDFLYHGKMDVENLKIEQPHFAINLYPKLRREDRQNHVVDSARIAMEHELDSVMQKFKMMDRIIARVIPKQLSLIKIDTLQADSSVLSFNIRDTLNNITTGTSSDFNLNATGFYFNKDSVSPDTKIMFAKSYDLDLNHFQFLLPDKTHIVKTGNIKISTDEGNISVTDISVYPDNMLESNSRNQINAHCPGINIVGVDFAAYDSTGIFSIADCNFDSTYVSIMRTQDTVHQAKREPRKRRQKFFNGLIINNVQTFGSSFGIIDENADKIAEAKLDVSCQNFCLDSANIAKANSLITFQNPYLDITDVFAKIKLNHLTVNHLHHENDSTKITDFAFGNPNDTTRAGFKVPEIRFTGLDYQQLAFNKRVFANSLYFKDPAIRITQKHKRNPNAPKKQFAIPNLPWNFEIADISADGASVNLKRPEKRDLFWDKIDLHADGISTETEHQSMYPADHILVGINDYTFNFRDSIYRINFGRTVVDPINRTGIIDQIDYRPKIPRYELYQHFDVRKSAIYFNCEKAYLYDFDVPKLFTELKIDVGRMDVERFQMQSYENQTKPNDFITPKPNLHAFIKEKIPIKVTVDTTYIRNSFVGVEQLNPEAGVPGLLTINDISGKVLNFTNDPADIARNNAMLMSATGKLMNIANVNGKIKYVMDSPTDEFVCNFSADTIHLPDLNPYLENAIFAKINDGTVSAAQVNFKSDNIESRGESHIVYRDLKLQVNKRDSVQQRRRGLLSLLANTVVRTKNTRKIGYIYAKCNPGRSFTGYWVQSILSGIKATAGFENKQQKGERRVVKKVVDVVMRRKMRQEYIIGEF